MALSVPGLDRSNGLQLMLKGVVKQCVLSGTRRHTRASQAHDRRAKQKTVEFIQGRRTVGGVDDSPWLRRHATPLVHLCTRCNPSSGHTHGEYRETYQKEGETDNVGSTRRAHCLHTSSTAHGRYTHSRLRGDETLTRGREKKSALAQVLFNTQLLHHTHQAKTF